MTPGATRRIFWAFNASKMHLRSGPDPTAYKLCSPRSPSWWGQGSLCPPPPNNHTLTLGLRASGVHPKINFWLRHWLQLQWTIPAAGLVTNGCWQTLLLTISADDQNRFTTHNICRPPTHLEIRESLSLNVRKQEDSSWKSCKIKKNTSNGSETAAPSICYHSSTTNLIYTHLLSA